MEYVCTIYRNPRDFKFWLFTGKNSVRLPLFDKFLKRIQSGDIDGDFLIFSKEDRYSPSLIDVYPPKEITEEQINAINQKWNYCVENNISRLEFEI